MIASLALALALQAGPQIEKIEPVLGNVRRPLLWTPLRVTLSSETDFSGDVVAKSGFGFSVARSVTLKAGGREVILLPALDPAEIQAGQRTSKPPQDFVRPDRIVLVDARLPYAAELISTGTILYQRISPEDLEKTLPRGLLEAADLVLVKEPMGGGVVAATREEAEEALALLGDPPASLELADRAVWPLAPRERWVPAKKSWALYFATVYAFAAFVALTVVARRFPKFGLASLAGVAVLGIAGYGAFPRSQMWIVGQAAEVVTPSGEAVEQRLWFLQSALEVAAGKIEFPRLVKPVFPTTAGAEEPFTIRVDERGCSVEGLKLYPGRAVCFGGIERRTATLRAMEKLDQPLKRSVLARAGRVAFLGDLAAGAAIPAEPREGGIPPGPEFEAWKRFVGRDGLFGILDRPERAAASVKSPELVDEWERPPVFIQRFK
ncbi:MAG: hypothetical protein HY293_10775 [Planctomycetes bacterium]|nr:hypothetical protein [Planctomycetota bacterium]